MPNDTVDFESEYWRLAEAVYALMETDQGKRAAFLMPDQYRATLEQLWRQIKASGPPF